MCLVSCPLRMAKLSMKVIRIELLNLEQASHLRILALSSELSLRSQKSQENSTLNKLSMMVRIADDRLFQIAILCPTCN